jgi:hypothetical protein
MKKLLGLFLLLTLTALFLFCTKRLFRSVRIKGILTDWYNHQPASGTVRVFSDSQRRQSREELTFFPLSSDGSFDKKFKAAREGHYFILFNQNDPLHGSFGEELAIKDKSTHDFGEMMIAHRFVCEITLKYTSWRDVSINFTSNTDNKAFPRYANEVFHMTQSMTQSEFEQNNGTYNLSYHILGASISEFSTVAIPILQSDTVRAEVQF